ncbi:MAG: Bax inhibitor-1/YccA family protein [Alphaproteobacteria bacterium]|nr:Bax inhibitor-1/YccA family protein [Alphaproteobacteria bacterium]
MSDYDRNAAARWGKSLPQARTQAEIDEGLRSYMLGIYNHMTLGLAISALVAVGIYMIGPSAKVLYTSPIKWVIMLAPLAFILVLSWRFENMSYTSLLGTFWAFAAVMGLSLGAIGFVFKAGSIVTALLATTIAFGTMSLWGYTTKRSLSGMGSFLLMGLIGLIVAMIVNIFLKSPALHFAISGIGVLIFAGLTAWDTQRLKEDYDYVSQDNELMGKSSIMGALSLYLNFVNMFQFILSLAGNRE